MGELPGLILYSSSCTWVDYQAKVIAYASSQLKKNLQNYLDLELAVVVFALRFFLGIIFIDNLLMCSLTIRVSNTSSHRS
jgi:hypothetical protein